MRKTEVLTMLEIELRYAWSKAMEERRQNEHRKLRARAIELYNLIKKQKTITGVN